MPLVPCTGSATGDEVDILAALRNASRSVDNILGKCTEEDEYTVYQCQQLKNFSEAQSYYLSKFKEYCCSVDRCIKSRLSWSVLQLTRDIIFLLSTHGWEKLLEECTKSDMEVIERLV